MKIIKDLFDPETYTEKIKELARYSSICYDHICNIYHIVWKHKR